MLLNVYTNKTTKNIMMMKIKVDIEDMILRKEQMIKGKKCFFSMEAHLFEEEDAEDSNEEYLLLAI